LPESGTTRETACPTTNDKHFTKLVGQAFSLLPSTQMTDTNGEPLAPESLKMIDYLRTRAAEMSAAAIRDRLRAATLELENVIASVDTSEIRLQPIEGKWTIAGVVDHIAQSSVRAAEELRHLLAGRRPPLPPVYEALRSGAADWAPWRELVEGLHDANRSLIELLESAPDSLPQEGAPTVRTIMVATRRLADGTTGPQIWIEELPWKEYALLHRLHVLDHRTQIKKLCAALAASA
jgi:hypothetical protein